mmetsp:Transcript_63459/g.206879  ORF Transcript_63459/g.206879 Transcript_63459/m.206879 type:complete len:277 (-) Transcript_63459:335-1165(-)
MKQGPLKPLPRCMSVKPRNGAQQEAFRPCRHLSLCLVRFRDQVPPHSTMPRICTRIACRRSEPSAAKGSSYERHGKPSSGFRISKLRRFIVLAAVLGQFNTGPDIDRAAVVSRDHGPDSSQALQLGLVLTVRCGCLSLQKDNVLHAPECQLLLWITCQHIVEIPLRAQHLAQPRQRLACSGFSAGQVKQSDPAPSNCTTSNARHTRLSTSGRPALPASANWARPLTPTSATQKARFAVAAASAGCQRCRQPLLPWPPSPPLPPWLPWPGGPGAWMP